MIVVAGEALVDLVVDRTGAVNATLGGGPFNTARTIGRLGSEVSFIGAISRDRFGESLHRQLLADWVDDSLVQLTDLPTTIALAELDEHGAARYHFYLADTSAPNLPAVQLPRDLQIVHIGTLGLVLEPMASVLEAAVRSIGDATLLVLDPNCRAAATPDRAEYLERMQRLLRRVDVVKVSGDDLEFLRPGDHDGALAMLRAGGAVVLHTDGARRVRIHTPTTALDVAVPVVDVVDTIGAGDAFGGAFVAWWAQAGLCRDDLSDARPIREAVAAAVEVAARNCARVGADPPRRAELGDLWAPARR